MGGDRLSLIGRPDTRRAPAFSIPLRFFLTALGFGVLGFLATAADARALTAGQPATPGTLATLHTLTLGFLSMAMMGALYQWVPVMTGTPLASERLARWHFALFAPGVAVWVGGLARLRPAWLAVGGSLVLAGVAIFLVNLGRTLLAARRPLPLPVWFVGSALGALGLAAALGGWMAAEMTGLFGTAGGVALLLDAHVTLALAGWLGLTLVGVSWRLFALFRGVRPDPLGAKRVWWFANFAVALPVAADLAGAPPWLRGALLAPLAVVLAGYGRGLFGYWRRRPRGRARDGALRLMVLAPLALAVGLGEGGWRAAQGHWLIGVFLLLWGWFTLSLLGYGQRILPFMVWLQGERRGRPGDPRGVFWPRRSGEVIAWLGGVGFGLQAVGVGLGRPLGLEVGALLQALGLTGLWLGLVRLAGTGNRRTT